jgi:1-deoxy-D-xylulose 5-phosphate reductoisomerase
MYAAPGSPDILVRVKTSIVTPSRTGIKSNSLRMMYAANLIFSSLDFEDYYCYKYLANGQLNKYHDYMDLT